MLSNRYNFLLLIICGTTSWVTCAGDSALPESHVYDNTQESFVKENLPSLLATDENTSDQHTNEDIAHKEKRHNEEGISYYQPEQIHISFGDDPLTIVVTWSTKNDTNGSIVEYGIDGLISRKHGTSTRFVDGGYLKNFQYIHRVVLDNLRPLETYLYHCGSDKGWSAEFWFKTVNPEEKWSPHLAVYGDMGNKNAQSLPRLQRETQNNVYDAILHVGDFAYDMATENGRVGDEFMKQIEPIAAYVPYMTVPGNHEEKYNFSHYKARFSMPGNTESLMYSFNMGPAHFIGFSTESYYFIEYGLKQVILQYEWLENDLKEATKPENRAKRPWIITFGHRPMYCSNSDKDDCTYHSTLVRVGLPIFKWFGLEKLFYDYGVDLELWAHEHSYERLWPVYDQKVYNGSSDEPYTNPGAPVHIITGSAGCQEMTDTFIPKPAEWSAFRSSDYGYARLKVYNTTHLHVEQVSDDKHFLAAFHLPRMITLMQSADSENNIMQHVQMGWTDYRSNMGDQRFAWALHFDIMEFELSAEPPFSFEIIRKIRKDSYKKCSELLEHRQEDTVVSY